MAAGRGSGDGRQRRGRLDAAAPGSVPERGDGDAPVVKWRKMHSHKVWWVEVLTTVLMYVVRTCLSLSILSRSATIADFYYPANQAI
jgi:hypothetical protein